jgi:hypothetical protein
MVAALALPVNAPAWSGAVVVVSCGMAFETTASRIWKHLPPAERKAAADSFFAEPPSELLGTAHMAIVKARHLRPQAARSLKPEEQARILSGVLDIGESLAASLLVALHLGSRRPLLVTFLDAVGLPHQDGLLKEEADSLGPITEDKAREGVKALRGSFPEQQVHTYLNTLWLQDPERWQALETSEG